MLITVKDALFLMGMHMWDMGYEKGLGDVETFEAVKKAAPAAVFPDSKQVSTVMATQFIWAGRWVENACPIIQLSGHRHAAALMSTGMPSAADLRAPWSSFMIEVPTGILGAISRVLVMCRKGDNDTEEKWSILGMSKNSKDESISLHFLSQRADRVCVDVADVGATFGDAFVYDMPDFQARMVLLLRRLVVNTCIAMANSTATKIGKHPDGWTRGPHRGPPAFRVFRVGKPIEMDCRPSIQAYLGGVRRDPLKVQFLVRGHWRHQTHGPRGELRKLIWIQPFWKGPEDAVILRRSHVVTDTQ